MSAVTWCRCAHQRIQHRNGQRCIVAGCGCLFMRPGPIPAALRFRRLPAAGGAVTA